MEYTGNGVTSFVGSSGSSALFANFHDGWGMPVQYYCEELLMRIELTELSAREISAMEFLDISDVLPYLERDFRLRTFSDVLRSLYIGDDIIEKLASAFMESDLNEESVRRKVRNWLNDVNIPQSREDIFVIAFVLGLDEAQASALLGCATDAGIHYRDGRELCYAYCLKMKYGYPRARKLFSSLPKCEDLSDTTTPYTQSLRDEFAAISDDDSFRKLYIERLPQMGETHNKAYAYFRRYLDILMNPEASVSVSFEEITREYLSMRVRPGRNRREMTATQKLILNGWPNATAMKNTRARKIDVSRKLLILLYLVTENVVDGEYREEDEDYIPPNDRMETHWYNLSLILDDCGMPPLDPRAPFDWLALYSLHVADDDETMSGRMERVLESAFK